MGVLSTDSPTTYEQVTESASTIFPFNEATYSQNTHPYYEAVGQRRFRLVHRLLIMIIIIFSSKLKYFPPVSKALPLLSSAFDLTCCREVIL